MARTESPLTNRMEPAEYSASPTDPRTPPPYGREASSDDIRRDIDRTRGEMDGTIDELTQRLNPRHLLDDVLDIFRSDDGTGGNRQQYQAAARSVGKKAFRQVKEHPVPALLIGAGLAWLMMEEDDEDRIRRHNREPRMHSGSYVDARTGEPYDESYGEEFRQGGGGSGMTERAKGTLGQAGEKIAGAGGSIREGVSGAAAKAGEWTGQATGKAGEWAGRTRHGAGAMGHSVRSGVSHYGSRASDQIRSGYAYSTDRFEDAVEDYPLAVGVGFLALGALVGLALPRTRREDELMGERADEMKDRAREMGEEMVDRGKQVANATAETVKGDVGEQGLTPNTLGEKVMHVAQRAATAANEAAHEEGIAPSDLKEKAKTVAQHAKETAKDETKHQTQDVQHQTPTAG